ncbi:unnamed protein product [Mortierella alpina]
MEGQAVAVGVPVHDDNTSQRRLRSLPLPSRNASRIRIDSASTVATHVLLPPPSHQRLAGRPGHPLRGGSRRDHPLRHRLGPHCMQMDELLYSVAEKIKNFAVIYLVDITEVPDFNKMYELYDPCTTMFFFRNKHIMVDLGTGNNNKINWALDSKQELIDIVETVFRGARKGRGLVVSPKDYSTKYKY